jgi:ABC-2 type transport system ATP-binding protein
MFNGRVLASDTPENLQRRMAGGNQIVAEIAAPEDALNAVWDNLAEVEHFDVSAVDGDFFRCALTPRDGVDLRPVIFELACKNGWTLRELTRSHYSLEDIYVQVTKPRTEETE